MGSNFYGIIIIAISFFSIIFLLSKEYFKILYKEQRYILCLMVISIAVSLILVPWVAQQKNSIYYFGYSGEKPKIWIEGDFKSRAELDLDAKIGSELSLAKTDAEINQILGKSNKYVNKKTSDKNMIAYINEDMEVSKKDVLAKGEKIYPNWVRDNLRIDYLVVLRNIVISLLSGSILFGLSFLYRRNK